MRAVAAWAAAAIACCRAALACCWAASPCCSEARIWASRVPTPCAAAAACWRAAPACWAAASRWAAAAATSSLRGPRCSWDSLAWAPASPASACGHLGVLGGVVELGQELPGLDPLPHLGVQAGHPAPGLGHDVHLAHRLGGAAGVEGGPEVLLLHVGHGHAERGRGGGGFGRAPLRAGAAAG